MKRLMLIIGLGIFVSFFAPVSAQASAWEWKKEEIRRVETKIMETENKLFNLDVDQIGLRLKWVESAIPLCENDRGLIQDEIQRLKTEMETMGATSTPTWDSSQRDWQRWEELGEKITQLEGKRNRLDYAVERLKNLKERLSMRLEELKKAETEQKNLLKAQLMPIYAGIGFTAFKKEKKGTETEYDSFPSGEFGMRMSLKRWTSLCLFTGYGKKGYVGLSVFIPVVSPEEGKMYGSWIEGGITSYPAILLGLSLESGKNWRLSVRLFFTNDEKEKEIPALQAWIARTF